MDQNSGKPSQKRRAILQGSLAAPVVLTVSSVSAQTATTFGRCLRSQLKDGEQPTGTSLFATSQDSWYRKRVTVSNLTHGSDDGWFFLDPVQNKYVDVDGKLASVDANLSGGWQVRTTSNRWMVVWVDTAGNEYSQMQIQRPSNYTAAPWSCYTSVKPTAVRPV